MVGLPTQDKDKTGLEPHTLELSRPRKAASLFFALMHHHRLDASCISKRIEAGTRSTSPTFLHSLEPGPTMSRWNFLHTILVYTTGRKSSFYKKTGSSLFESPF
ncbi:hypothetical protein NXS19_011752 [Fusarium pseudograminearum]|nr:hypothetical protein NXS19_011752 [Fusarium pseudograminearum]